MDQNRRTQEAVREKGSVPETELNVTQLKVISSAEESLSHRWRVGRVREAVIKPRPAPSLSFRTYLQCSCNNQSYSYFFLMLQLKDSDIVLKMPLYEINIEISVIICY